MSEPETMPETLPMFGGPEPVAPGRRERAGGNGEPGPVEVLRRDLAAAWPEASPAQAEAAFNAACGFAATMIERFARKPGGLGRQR